MKHFISVLAVVIFVLFSIFILNENSYFEVLEVITPTEIVIDFNKNKIADNNETVILNNIFSFSIHPERNKFITDKFKLSTEDGIRLGYFAENYAKDLLLNKNVKFKNNEIFINNIKYKDLIINKGLASQSDYSDALKNNLEKAKNINLVILNKKNYKYHKLNCKYGQMAHNYIIVPFSQLSNDAQSCKYCRTKQNLIENSQQIKRPDLVLKNTDIELFLTDMSVNLKPNNKCLDKICQAILREINLADKTIDFAIYGYSKIPKLENALLKAQKRGVKIRFVFDTKDNTNIYPDTFYLAKLFPDNNFDKSKAIMHNKFFIFDNKKVFTGSANISTNDMSGFSSNSSVLINSKEIAHIYTKEFEQMYEGKFHEEKSKISKENKSNVKVYFSPKDDIIYNELIPLINNAKSYIYIPAFIITHEKMAQSIISAKQRGVDVKIILDATNTKSPSKIIQLRNANIPVKTENYAGKLHSKSMIIDDKYIVIGSMNFSVSGAKYNDENVVIISDENLAKFYKRFFMYLWSKIPDIWLKYSVSAESKNSVGSCSDGIDNDYDGDIDLADSGCKK